MFQNVISRGIYNNLTVKITYVDKNGERTVRETEPYEIKNGRYFGYCLVKNGIRGFMLNGIVHAELTDNHFTPRF